MKPKGSQFVQLPMFMRAGDLTDPHKVVHADSSSDAVKDRDVESLQFVKLGESKAPGTHEDTWDRGRAGPSLHESIAAEGVKEPVTMTYDREDWRTQSGPRRLMLNDGHHRAFAAADINPDMEIPVTYDFPTIDTEFNGPLGELRDTLWNDRTRNPDQTDPWPARERD